MNTVFATSNSSLLKPLTGGLQLLAIAAFLGAASLPVLAQGYGSPGSTTLRDPLIPGASWTSPGVPAAPGLPPPIGSGAVPMPINPGQLGGPTFEPWVPYIPANQIDQPSSRVNVPFAPATALPPGAAGPMINSPPPPSTPGADPGILRMPSSAAIVTPSGNGRYPDNAAPTTHRPAATTRDFGLPRSQANSRAMSNLYDSPVRLGEKPVAVGPRYCEDGPKPKIPATRTPAAGDPAGGIKYTTDLYGAPMLSNTNGGLTPLTTIAPY
jgi:hypothetical protein